jgi:signal peptidase II
VRDWILWQANDRWRWPNFNIADSLLVIGAAVLFFHALRQPNQATKEIADDKRSARLQSDASS